LPSDESQPKSKLREEAQLLRRAREALRRGDLPAASSALDTATHAFPRGALTEEREALSIELLSRSGQREAARLRAATFLREFPASPYAANVRAITE
jgi:outer membrane protein assembly factor BamD (BamD/ComL family)